MLACSIYALFWLNDAANANKLASRLPFLVLVLLDREFSSHRFQILAGPAGNCVDIGVLLKLLHKNILGVDLAGARTESIGKIRWQRAHASTDYPLISDKNRGWAKPEVRVPY